MLKLDNKQNKKRVPIVRNNKFFSGEDFNMELDFAKEYIEQDAHQTVILYRVDMETTNVNDIYKESKQGAVKFKSPIEIPVVFEIDDAEMKTYDNNKTKGVYAKPGKLTFGVLISTLEDYDCDINRGDYIGVQINEQLVEYYVVSDDGRVGSYSNKRSLYGIKGLYRTIVAAPVDKIEFNA